MALWPTFSGVTVSDEVIIFSFHDGRTVSVPLAWSEKLQRANDQQRRNIVVSDYYVFWDDVDEIIGVRNVLYGQKLFL